MDVQIKQNIFNNVIYCVKIDNEFQEIADIWEIGKQNLKEMSESNKDAWEDFSLVLLRLFYLEEQIVQRKEGRFKIYYTLLEENETEKDLIMRVLSLHRALNKKLELYSCTFNLIDKTMKLSKPINVKIDKEEIYEIYSKPLSLTFNEDKTECSFFFFDDYDNYLHDKEKIFNRLKYHFEVKY